MIVLSNKSSHCANIYKWCFKTISLVTYQVLFMLGFFYRILAIMDTVSGYANKERQNLYNQVLPLRSNSVHSIHRCDPGNGRVSDSWHREGESQTRGGRGKETTVWGTVPDKSGGCVPAQRMVFSLLNYFNSNGSENLI